MRATAQAEHIAAMRGRILAQRLPRQWSAAVLHGVSPYSATQPVLIPVRQSQKYSGLSPMLCLLSRLPACCMIFSAVVCRPIRSL